MTRRRNVSGCPVRSTNTTKQIATVSSRSRITSANLRGDAELWLFDALLAAGYRVICHLMYANFLYTGFDASGMQVPLGSTEADESWAKDMLGERLYAVVVEDSTAARSPSSTCMRLPSL